MLCLTPDLPPNDATLALPNQLAKLAIGHIRAADVASTFLPSCVALLLIDAETRNLAGILQRLQEALEPISLAGRFTLSAGGGCYPQTATGGSELLLRALDLMARAKSAGGNRLYLPS